MPSTNLNRVNRARWEAAERRRVRVAELLSDGLTLEKALLGAGVSSSAYQRWRSDPGTKHWAATFDQARFAGKARRAEMTPLELQPTPDDFSGFVGAFFPDRRPHMRHQLLLAATLENLRPREIVMFLLWPEAGKTATIEDYVSRKLAYDPSHRFRIVSEAKDLAERMVGTCKRRFTDTENYSRFIARFGPFYEAGQEKHGRPWGAQQITLAKNPGSERDRNLVASSWTSTVYGSRIDTLILDDVQSQRNLSQSEEIFNRIRGTFLNRGLEMRVIIVGTRIGHGDVYDRFLDAGLISERNVIEVPAAGAWGQDASEPTVPEFWTRPGFTHDGTSCCPPGLRICPNTGDQLTPREFMELIRFQSGPEAWHASYQQNPVANELSTFGEYLPQCLDPNRSVGVLV